VAGMSGAQTVVVPRPSRVRLAVAAVIFASVLLIAALVALVVALELDASYEPAQSLLSNLPDVAMVTAFALVGAIVVVKRPENLVGWSLSLAGSGMLFGGVLAAYAELALFAKPEAQLPAGAAAAAIAQGSWVPLMAGVFLVLLLFPTGRLPSPRWRLVARLVLFAFAAAWVAVATAPRHLDPPFEAYESPLAPTSSGLYLVSLFALVGVVLVGVALAAVNLLLRFRRSRGVERQQFKWLAVTAGLLVVTLPFAAAFNWTAVAGAVFGLELIALPVAVGIAVLRYRLYDIDLIVRRTLVYGVLSAGLTGVYFGVVLGLQQVFSSFAGASDLAIAGSTLAVAALFRPARTWVQALVDRRFYRRKYDAGRTMADFAARLREEVDLDKLRTELTEVVGETMEPAHVSLWLREAP
jgi:hypothetical protein